MHAVVTRFPHQNAQSPPFADPFWTFGCRASACRCGEKHISKPKSTKQTRSGNGSDGMSGNVPPCRSNCCSVLFVNWFRFSTNRGIAERIAAIYAFSLCLCRKLTWLRPLHPAHQEAGQTTWNCRRASARAGSTRSIKCMRRPRIPYIPPESRKVVLETTLQSPKPPENQNVCRFFGGISFQTAP